MADGGFPQALREFESGAAVPAVDPADIERMWQLFARTLGAAREAGIHNRIFGPHELENACSPGANVAAVWLRTGLLLTLLDHGPLNAWQPESEFEKRLFELIAVFPVAGLNWEPELFMQQLGGDEN
jgi:hypothetical protein